MVTRIVQIGVGGWGKNHVRVLSQIDSLAAICDIDSDRSKKFGSIFDVNHYTNIDEMIKSEEFDGAIICTPTSTHYQVASQLIHHGKNVFVEKPMTYHSHEGVKLRTFAKEAGVKLTCGYIERFNPAVSNVKKYVEAKTYGELIMLEFHRESRMPLHIKDVGIIYDTAVHDIDTAMWLFNEFPETVYARAGRIKHEHEDFATIMLGFSDQKVAVIASNWITPTRIRTFEAVLTEGIITGDFITQDIKIETSEGSYKPRKNIEEPLLLEIKNFIDAIEGTAEQIVTSQDAVNVTRIAEAALESSKSGKPVPLKL